MAFGAEGRRTLPRSRRRLHFCLVLSYLFHLFLSTIFLAFLLAAYLHSRAKNLLWRVGFGEARVLALGGHHIGIWSVKTWIMYSMSFLMKEPLHVLWCDVRDVRIRLGRPPEFGSSTLS
ncbi:hypothetical protein BCR34DRAFT_292458 [Clohesyomyces aquaticus]|uniref:Uncharacterized protein n=1 Tax=Clohesyomyces aquaticus TaxID=1231657 RepID=A0A1Y2A866_9PLEO|nr:hypothetical protein BCR34DRAFT_292458 [Clohesyomyces aquaticus]